MDIARAQTSRLLDLLRREQGAMADFLLALAAFDRQRLWVGMGYGSLFHYLRRELKLSSGSAFLRKTAAELLQRFPEVEGPLRDGRLCISSVAELAKVMTPENRAEVLPRFFFASKNEAKELAAEIAPREAVPQRVVLTTVAPRAVPSVATAAVPEAPERAGGALPLGTDRRLLPEEVRQARPGAAPTLDFGRAVLPEEAAARDVASPVESSPCMSAAPQPVASTVTCAPARVSPPAAPRTTTEPLTATQHRLHATVSKEFVRKLAAAKDALSHSLPGADEAAILEAGLDLILERAAKRKGLVKRPRKTASGLAAESKASRSAPEESVRAGAEPGVAAGRLHDGARKARDEEAGAERDEGGGPEAPPDSRHIPAAVQREVWTRDEGRCAWPTADGGVCGSTWRLQFDHILAVRREGSRRPPIFDSPARSTTNSPRGSSSGTAGWTATRGGPAGGGRARHLRAPWRRREGARRRAIGAGRGPNFERYTRGPPMPQPCLPREEPLLALMRSGRRTARRITGRCGGATG